ncbi:hypothetical protein ACT3RN_15035, partial [Psychrobacter sp. AOP5-GZ1-6]
MDGSPVARAGDIYFAPKAHEKDFSLASDAASKHFFIHEMTHVWQYQNGQTVALRAIGEQLFFEFPSKIGLGDGAYVYKLDQSKNLLDYEIEQQASIVADYWAMKNRLIDKVKQRAT